MLHILVFVIPCQYIKVAEADNSAIASDYGANLISSLRNDANLDLPVDEEYEDLRAQLFAYQSALSSLAPSRRSLLTTPCWRRGGICISYKLCPGYRQLTEVPGCKNRHNVCCFVWNKYEIRELKDQGINNLAFPWNIRSEYGGHGVQQVTTTRKPRKKSTHHPPTNNKKQVNTNSRKPHKSSEKQQNMKDLEKIQSDNSVEVVSRFFDP